MARVLVIGLVWLGVCFLIPGTTINLLAVVVVSLALGWWAVSHVTRRRIAKGK